MPKKKRSQSVEYRKASSPKKDPVAERIRKGKQEQVDEIAGLMRQLDPTIQTPKVRRAKNRSKRAIS
jgi:hypothetical protein